MLLYQQWKLSLSCHFIQPLKYKIWICRKKKSPNMIIWQKKNLRCQSWYINKEKMWYCLMETNLIIYPYYVILLRSMNICKIPVDDREHFSQFAFQFCVCLYLLFTCDLCFMFRCASTFVAGGRNLKAIKPLCIIKSKWIPDANPELRGCINTASGSFGSHPHRHCLF